MVRSQEHILQYTLIGLLAVNITAISALLYIGYGIQRDIRQIQGRFHQAGEVAGDAYALVAGSALDKVLTVNKYGQSAYQSIGSYLTWPFNQSLEQSVEEPDKLDLDGK